MKAGRGGRPAKSASQAPADGTSGSGAVESDAEEYGSSQGQRVQTPPGEAQAALKHEVSGDVAMLDAPEPAIPQPQPQHQVAFGCFMMLTELLIVCNTNHIF